MEETRSAQGHIESLHSGNTSRESIIRFLAVKVLIKLRIDNCPFASGILLPPYPRDIRVVGPFLGSCYIRPRNPVPPQSGQTTLPVPWQW